MLRDVYRKPRVHLMTHSIYQIIPNAHVACIDDIPSVFPNVGYVNSIWCLNAASLSRDEGEQLQFGYMYIAAVLDA